MNANQLPLAYIIEDDKNLSRAFAQALNEASYRTVIIRNGLEALARLKDQVPATIILDLHIPGIAGPDLLHYLKSDRRFNNVKVIVTTADDRKASEITHIADLILIKPVGFSQLRDMARRVNPILQ